MALAFLSLAGAARAQDGSWAQGGDLSTLTNSAAMRRQSAAISAQMQASGAPVNAETYNRSAAMVEQAGLKPSQLSKMGWTDLNISDLGPAIKAASRAVQKLHDENPSAVGDQIYGNGTMVNLEDSIKYATGMWGGSDLKRGCLTHQSVTLDAARPVLKNGSLDIRGIFAVRRVTPHHAVIVFPKGSDWKKTGVVLDGWIHQESAPDRMTYLFTDWYGPTIWKVALE